MRALIDSNADWFWFLLLVVGVLLLVVVIAVVGFRHDRNRQRECREIGGLVVPAQDGWVCALPNPYKVEK